MPDNSIHARSRVLTRRRTLRYFGLSAAGVVLAGCGTFDKEPARDTAAGEKAATPGDFSARFAAYQPADEPNADPSKVVWPEFVLRAGPEVQRLYEFALVNGELLRYMPCFCGCGASGHRNNRDCYVRAVNPDGSVVFDDMAPT